MAKLKILSQLIVWVIVLGLVLWLPELSFIILPIYLGGCVWKKIRNKPFLTFEIKRK